MVIVIFCFAFFLILKGGDLLVESAVNFASKTKIPSFVVGSTIVAIATTMPEMSVSIASGVSGESVLAVNTAIGSMMCNFALVLGIVFLLFPSSIGTRGLVSKVLIFLACVITMFILGIDGSFGLVDAIILSTLFVVNIVISIFEGRKFDEPVNTLVSDEPWWKIIIQFVVSTFAIGFGANVLVGNVEELSAILGVSEGIVGMFIIAIGTNIPELVTTISAVKLADTEIGVGNIFGASIIDSTLLIGVTVLSSNSFLVAIPKLLILVTVPSLFLITFIIASPILKNNKSSRIQGVILLIVFIIYSLILAKIS